MSLATALKGAAAADARPLQNSDFRRLWVTQIITIDRRAADCSPTRRSSRHEARATTGCGVDLRRSAVDQRLVRPDRVVEVAEAVDLDGEGVAVADVGTVSVPAPGPGRTRPVDDVHQPAVVAQVVQAGD
jgi:hypothetical protein